MNTSHAILGPCTHLPSAPNSASWWTVLASFPHSRSLAQALGSSTQEVSRGGRQREDPQVPGSEPFFLLKQALASPNASSC